MEQKAFEKQYMSKLNKQQKTAVRTSGGNTLLLAVPGSGKTTVLVLRLGYLLQVCGVEPESMLTVTYTRAATAEMKERFARLFGQALADRMEWRTINGLSAIMVEWYARNISRRKPFELLDDEKELARLLRGIYSKFSKEAPTDSTINDMRASITYCKNMLLSDTEIKEKKWEIASFPQILEEYNRILRSRGLMDYDDQMGYALKILQQRPEVLNHFRNRFRHISVDEAQDSSRIQNEIIRILSQGSESLFMVGDEDQSIYGFRAACPEAMLCFEQDYENAKVLKMEENFRSGRRIVELAQHFVEKNPNRHPKTLRAFRRDNAVLRLVPTLWRENQYAYLLQVAKNCTKDTAVLYRNNDSALPLIDLLEREGIAYACRAADLSFFTHRVVADVCDIIRFAGNESDGDCFLRIYYKLGRFISKEVAYAAALSAKKSGGSVLEALAQMKDAPDYMVSGAKELSLQFQSLRSDTGERVMDRISRAIGYENFAQERSLDQEKIPILRLLAKQTQGMNDFIDRLEELRRLIANHSNKKNVLFHLSTIHSSKGLEFERVFLLDIHDGDLPQIKVDEIQSEEDEKLAEEERRLFYVAMTRAKNELCFFRYQDRSSSFLRELLPMLLKEKALTTADADAIAQPKLGQVLVHKYYGQGVVNSFNGQTVVLRFFDGSVRGFLWEYALEKGLFKGGDS